MRKMLVISVFVSLAAVGLAAHGKTGIRDALLSGWVVRHFSDDPSPVIMLGKNDKMIAAVTDNPDSLEVWAFQGDGGSFLAFRDRDHDRIFEEIDGVSAGMLVVLDGERYTFKKTEDQWSLEKAP